MTRRQWKMKIKKACNKAGTYQAFFDSVIDTLAGIMELRDEAREEYEEDGRRPVVEHTNKSGAVNLVRNPALSIIADCESQALAYWKELGLTARSYKTLSGQLNISLEARGIEDALADLGI